MTLGIIVAYFGNFLVDGVNEDGEEWMLCDGREISRTSYSALYAIIQNAFGYGDNQSTFNLPDLRGRFIRGLDTRTSKYKDPDVTARTAMNPGGNTGQNPGSVQGFQTGPHQHHLSGWTTVREWAWGEPSYPVVDTNPDDEANISTDSTGGVDVSPKNAYVHFLIRVN